MRRGLLPVIAVLLFACSSRVTPVILPSATAVIPTATQVTVTPLPTQTLAPYEQYTVDYLRRRAYGGGKIEIQEKLLETDLFSSYSFRYPSDGLTIYGFVSVPKGPGPFPVIVAIHGYARPGRYNVFDTKADYADYFAANQFVVFHPGLRNQPPSDSGDNILRVGMSVDVLNLIALLKQPADLPPALAGADPSRLGLWGTSMGGAIALRVLTIDPDIRAAVLLSPLSGDEVRNAKQLYKVVRDEQFQQDAQVPLELLDRVSPMYYYSRIGAAVQLNHGTADTTAPISWAVETCNFLQSAGVAVQCIYYPEAGHVFGGDNLLQNALEFYRIHLSP